MQQSEKFIIYRVNSDHMLEIDQKVTHGFGPSIPSNSLVHFIWVYMQFSYFSLSSTNKYFMLKGYTLKDRLFQLAVPLKTTQTAFRFILNSTHITFSSYLSR